MAIDFTEITETLGSLMISKDLFITTSESCTGGWVSKEITSISGSSKWFGCSFVTYSNSSKNEILGVKMDTLKTYGAVSLEVVSEMVEGALHLSGADIGVSISGVAGPTGGSKETPVGTVCMAWKKKGSDPKLITKIFSGNREEVRLQTVKLVLEESIKLVKSL